ncbi:dynamin-related protein 4C-like [Salvia miltiorrhiza]|uniref:dynamin-related protein 4C-like n=1 Tax=Salvia miltiorrhiza TaxID=226208 RepID=UPI0025AB8D22|nr:dynamin-related protein 4C-like [Salvia miltiorrhiza]
MNTRSHGNPLFELDPEINATLRNLKKQKNQAEPDTMATPEQIQIRALKDQMKKLLDEKVAAEAQKPPINEAFIPQYFYQEPPRVNVNNFELKTGLITMVQQSQYGGHAIEDPNAHLAHFLELCSTCTNLLKISKHHRQQVEEEDQESSPATAHDAPIFSPYNARTRPLLDTVDKLRHLKIMQEGIQLPTIIVVGDQSSLTLVVKKKANVIDEIMYTTQEIVGKGKMISNTPLTLVVKKKGVPDLTMIDLPGITRVPVKGQPEDISEQISNIIMKYITPEESIILNILSAGVDFLMCESIRMSQKVDKTGQRTLTVVMKADKSPEGLLEKVVADDVNIGLGYVCVRNCIGNETYEEARDEEANLFDNNPLLSRIDKSIVGIPALAERLTMIQANIIVKCLPEIVRKINEKLSANVEELNKMPKHLSSIAEVMTSFTNILGSARESLRKILLQGEFDEFPSNDDMHATAKQGFEIGSEWGKFDTLSGMFSLMRRQAL